MYQPYANYYRVIFAYTCPKLLGQVFFYAGLHKVLFGVLAKAGLVQAGKARNVVHAYA